MILTYRVLESSCRTKFPPSFHRLADFQETVGEDQLQLTVSVVIPVHNAEQFLGECLDSILKQDFPLNQVRSGYLEEIDF